MRGIAILATLTLAACSTTPSPTPTPSATWAPPPGYDVIQTGVAVQWVPNPTCPIYADQCAQLMVAARYGCPSGLFVEAATLDANGVQVGRTNDYVGAVTAGTIAKVTLVVTDNDATTIDSPTVRCR